MFRIILFIILIASITSSFNLLAYAHNSFTSLNLEEYNIQLDTMYDAIKQATDISNFYERELGKTQDILRETTDSEREFNLRWVIHEYQTYLNELDELKFNLDNNINALGEIARHTDLTTQRIIVPHNLIKVPKIPREPPSLPIFPEVLEDGRLSDSVRRGINDSETIEKLRRVAQADQEATRLARGIKRLERLDLGTRKIKAREIAAQRTEKITNDFFHELRERTYQAQLQKWQEKYPPQLVKKISSRPWVFLKGLGRFVSNIVGPITFNYGVYEFVHECERLYYEWRDARNALNQARNELVIINENRDIARQESLPSSMFNDEDVKEWYVPPGYPASKGYFVSTKFKKMIDNAEDTVTAQKYLKETISELTVAFKELTVARREINWSCPENFKL